MILLLHTLIEGAAALLFLFFPQAAELLPGFADAAGPSYLMLLKMYGLSAALLAGLSGWAWYRRGHTPTFLLVTFALSAYHYGMMLVQMLYNPDNRAGLLHFLLAIFLTGQYLGRRREGWTERQSTLN